jgi:hypothetical protein
MAVPKAYILNLSTVVPDATVQLMATAINYQISTHVAPTWNVTPIPVVWGGRDIRKIPSNGWAFAIVNDSNQTDALGWHTEYSSGQIYAEVFARPQLTRGYKPTAGQWSISHILSHEVVETFLDPSVNRWADDGETWWSFENCGPVEGNYYSVPAGRSSVAVSNFVYPSYWDLRGRAPYDRMGRILRPFQILKFGYQLGVRPGGIFEMDGPYG